MSVPESYSAIETNNTSFLFYVKRDGTITSLEQPSGKTGLYKQKDILMGGSPVKARVPRLSVVAYTDKNKKRQASFITSPVWALPAPNFYPPTSFQSWSTN